MTAILGISAFYHDSAAALMRGRPDRRRGSGRAIHPDQARPGVSHPRNRYCLHEGGLSPAELDYVAFYEKPLTKFERLLETYLAYAPARFPQLSAGDADMA